MCAMYSIVQSGQNVTVELADRVHINHLTGMLLRLVLL